MKLFRKIFGKSIESDVKNEEGQEYTLQEKWEEEDNVRRKSIEREESVTVLDKPVEENTVVETNTSVQEKRVGEAILNEERKVEKTVIADKEDEVDELEFILDSEVLEQQAEAERIMAKVKECYTQCGELTPTNTDEYDQSYWNYIEDWIELITLFETKYPEFYSESQEMIHSTKAKVIIQQNKWAEADEEIQEFRVRESALRSDIEKFGQAIKILSEKFGDSTNWGGKKQELVKYRKGLESRREVYLKEELQLNTKLKEVMEEHNQILKQVKFCWEYLLSVLEGITL